MDRDRVGNKVSSRLKSPLVSLVTMHGVSLVIFVCLVLSMHVATYLRILSGAILANGIGFIIVYEIIFLLLLYIA